MTRGLLAAAIVGLAALPATAGDVYAPYPGNVYNAQPNYAPLTGWHAGINHGATNGACNTCGTQRRDRRDWWQKCKDFLCYKPTIPCETWPKPTPYTPPLRMWFPPHGSGPCDTGCAATGMLGRRHAPCGTCNTCANGAGPIAPMAPAAQPWTPAGPVLNNYTTMARPASNVGPTIVPQSYTVTKPAYSTNLQGPGLPPPPSPYLPGGFAIPRN